MGCNKIYTCSGNYPTTIHNMAYPAAANAVPLFFFLLAAAAAVSATDHIVGANRGWNPGINYTLWANNHTIYVGDFISFRYQKNQYNVFEVNQTGYDNCTIEGATGNWTSGKDFILLTKAKRYFFICGTGGCFNGMKVTVLVHPLPGKSSTAKNTSVDSAASLPPTGGGSLLLRAILPVLVTWIWDGSKFGLIHGH